MLTLELSGSGSVARAYAAAAALAGWRITDDAASGADAVAITGPGVAVDDVLAALASGRAVVVEPSWCRSPDDAERVLEASRRAGRPVVHAEHFAYAPVFDLLVREVGGIGVPHHLEVRHLAPRADVDARGQGHDPAGAVDRMVRSLAPTAVTLAVLTARRAGAGAIVAVDPAITRAAVDVCTTIRFESGLRATVVVGSVGAALRTLDVQVASAEGVLRAELVPRPSVERNGEPIGLADLRTDPPELGWSGLVGQFAALATAMAHGAAPVTDPALAAVVCDVVARALSPVDDPSR